MILVTGGTGTIGRQLVAELQARGEDFRVAHRDAGHVQRVLGPGVDTVPFDFQDETTHLPAMRSADSVFLLTPTAPWATEACLRVIDAAREAGVEHLVRQSVLQADAHPTYLLGEWHRAVELYLLASGLPGTILRPNHFMDNFATFMGDRIRADNRFASGSGNVPVSYIAGADVAAVAAECLVNEEHRNTSYDLVGPEAITQTEVAEALTQATGRHIEAVAVDEQTVRESMAGAPDWLVRTALELDEFDRQGRMGDVNHNVETILGRPAQDIRSWAAAHADLFAPTTVTA